MIKKPILVLPLLLTVCQAHGYSLSDFVKNVRVDPNASYMHMFRQPVMNDVLSAIGIPKDQELAFLYQLLPESQQELIKPLFEASFGSSPDDLVGADVTYQMYGFVLARTKLPKDPIERLKTLTILAQLWQLLPSQTLDQKTARSFMRGSFKQLFNVYPDQFLTAHNS